MERREGQVDPEVLIFINNSPRPHHLEEFVKEHLHIVDTARMHSNNTTWMISEKIGC